MDQLKRRRTVQAALSRRPKTVSWRKRFLPVGRTSVLALFPDFLDLLALGLSAGLPFVRAWAMALKQLPKGPLAEDLAVFEAALACGKSTDEALAELSLRWKDPSMKMAAVLLGQSLRQGAEAHRALTSQADAQRERRFVDFERRAQIAPLKLLLPMFLFIFPAVFLILLGPLVVRFSQGFNLF